MYKNNHFLGLNWGMKCLSTLLLAFLLLGSCTSEDKTIPAGLLSKDKMSSILSDIHVVESAVSSKELPRDTSVFLYRTLEKQIFAKHGVSKKDFLSSYKWYASNLGEYKDLYKSVVDSLSLRSSVKQ